MLRPLGFAMILAFAALLAGCSGRTLPPSIQDPWPVDRPLDWNTTLSLVVFDGERSHSADQTLDAAPPANTSVPQPAGCAAYQDGRRSPYDSCAVEGPQYVPNGSKVPWTVRVHWDGRGEDVAEQERDESRRTVVAFADDGTPVAHVGHAIAMVVE